MRRVCGQGRRARCKNSSRRATRHRELTAWKSLHGKGRATGQQALTARSNDSSEYEKDKNYTNDDDDSKSEWVDIDSNNSQWEAIPQQQDSGRSMCDHSVCEHMRSQNPEEHIVVGREKVERKLAKLKTGVGSASPGGAGPFFR